MDQSAALTTVQIALGFASYNFSVAMQFFPKSHSRPCDYLYKLAPTSKRRLPKVNSINKVVDKLRRIRIADRLYQQGVIELKLFSRAISSDEKVEKEITIQRVAVQLTDGTGQKLRAHRGESQFQLLWTHTRKYHKVV